VAFSPDGQLLVTGHSDGWVFLWDFKNGKRVEQFLVNREDENLPLSKGTAPMTRPLMSPRAVRGLAFSSDGKRLVTGQSNGFKIWDAAKAFGRPFAEAPVVVNPKPRDVPAPAIKQDRIRELGTFRAHEKDITGLSISPEGAVLASAASPAGQAPLAAESGEIKLWNLEGNNQIARTAGDAIGNFTPDGKHIFCMMHSNGMDFLNGAVNGGAEVLSFKW